MSSTTRNPRHDGRDGPSIAFVAVNGRATSAPAPHPRSIGLGGSSPVGSRELPDAHTFAGVIEALAVGILVTDSTGRLLYSNESAAELLRAGDGLLLDAAGALRCNDRETQGKFRALLADASERDARGGAAALGMLSFPREERAPLTALAKLCTPVSTRQQTQRSRQDDRILLIIRDPEGRLEGCEARIADLFGLTRSEAQVAGQLAMGADIQEIADHRGVRLVTVRNQVKSVLGKIGVSRQAALVSLMLRAVLF